MELQVKDRVEAFIKFSPVQLEIIRSRKIENLSFGSEVNEENKLFSNVQEMNVKGHCNIYTQAYKRLIG